MRDRLGQKWTTLLPARVCLLFNMVQKPFPACDGFLAKCQEVGIFPERVPRVIVVEGRIAAVTTGNGSAQESEGGVLLSTERLLRPSEVKRLRIAHGVVDRFILTGDVKEPRRGLEAGPEELAFVEDVLIGDPAPGPECRLGLTAAQLQMGNDIKVKV